MEKLKYYNNKVILDGIKFDSKAEANRYVYLKLLEKSKIISNLKMQVPFELQPSFTKEKKKYRAINYIADFVYYDNNSKRVIVEDVKGYRTKEYQIKKKMFEYRYPNLKILEINERKNNGTI